MEKTSVYRVYRIFVLSSQTGNYILARYIFVSYLQHSYNRHANVIIIC